MTVLLYGLAFAALLLTGAIFGFFYAWLCSAMWGLDTIDPVVAIKAMQAMNAAVRNAVFAPAFFGTPAVLLAAAALAGRLGRRVAALAFGAAGLVYFGGGLVLTLLVNVPMNQALAGIDPVLDAASASSIWLDYSPAWQVWNAARTISSGVALALTGLALMALNARR